MPTNETQQATIAPAPATPPVFNNPQAALPIADVTVIIGYVDKDRKRTEVVHDLGPDVTIRSCIHSVQEKIVVVRDPDTKSIIGHEPTGEYELTLKVKYTKG